MKITHILSSVVGWNFDPISSVITIFVCSLLMVVISVVRKPVSDGIRYLVSGALYALSITLTKFAAAWLTLRRYCRLQLSGSSKYLYVPGMRDVNLDIDSIFVPLSLEQAGKGERFSHRNVVEAGGRIRIIGDPGSGKSSIAKRIFRDECKSGVDSPRSSRFPILMELNKIPFPKRANQKNAGEWLLKYIID
jgi:hypothetical protein